MFAPLLRLVRGLVTSTPAGPVAPLSRRHDCNSASTGIEPGLPDCDAPRYYCAGCGVQVEGHGCDQVRGLYYCRSCWQRHNTLLRFVDGGKRIVILLLGLLALSALILFLLWVLDGSHRL